MRYPSQIKIMVQMRSLINYQAKVIKGISVVWSGLLNSAEFFDF
jgi:hypothetical protein